MIISGIRMGIVSCGVIALAVLVLRIIYSKSFSQLNHPRQIQIVERLRLSNKNELIMIRWMGRDLLMSVGGDHLRMVTSQKSDGCLMDVTDGHMSDGGEKQ